VVYDSDGSILRDGTLGDGIDHLRVTRGHIWVGYSDEGVYGNYGWGMPGPEPIGSSGIVRFNVETLAPSWHFPGSSLGVIDDCYAMNVFGDDLWACYYSNFPVIRIANGELTGWANQLTGVSALIVGGGLVGLIGGYREDRDRAAVGPFLEDRIIPLTMKRITMPDGDPLPARVTMIGRGSELNVITPDAWHKLEIRDLIQDLLA
jgi:hypothetical protein